MSLLNTYIVEHMLFMFPVVSMKLDGVSQMKRFLICRRENCEMFHQIL